ncbi:hypothetical protein LCGC14_0414330 [marine sediment metagenome]|uniref:Uncharacterized protein n=1 Tax=marine sediment metagenome TaxID=412755 RepID=A0A0F9W1U3_9ZZZZ
MTEQTTKTPGPYEAVVLADSIASGVRLTTLCCTFPRIVLAEFNTHRVFSRNSASSRAIPVKRRIAQIQANPYVPLSFGKNKRGMQAKAEEVADAEKARLSWALAQDYACLQAASLASIGLHKQWANRLLEPFAWHTVIVSATEWDNYFALRDSEHAQPEIAKVTRAMKIARIESTPIEMDPGDWHLPLCGIATARRAEDIDTLVKLCVARCAAISYERHMEQNVEKALDRYDKLLSAGHMSPFEHAAVVGTPHPAYGGEVYVSGDSFTAQGPFIGNFRAPWIQHRKMLPGEAVFGSMIDE